MTPQEKIRNLLIERGWSQTQLAGRAGLSQRNMSYIVGSGREPGVKAAIAIATALCVPVDWLWSEADPPPPHTPSLQHPSDHEIIDELVRRRSLVQRDIETLVRRLRDANVLELHEAIAARAHAGGYQALSESEKGTYRSINFDLARIVHLNDQLSFLDPARHDQPTHTDDLATILKPYPALFRCWIYSHSRNLGASDSIAPRGSLRPAVDFLQEAELP